MASKDNDQLRQSSNADDIPLQNAKYVYEEDEYGYVDTKEKRISKSLISQLPSRNFDIIDLGSKLDEYSDRTLRRRQSRYRTLQLNSATLTSQQISSDVDKIYELLNLDPEAKEEDKLKTLREMHQSLTIKRQVKERLDADMERRRADQVLDKFTRLKLRTNIMWHKLLYELKNMTYSLEPWHSAIKTLQGQFGSCVASYFIFLRWLLYLNLSNFFVILFFVLTPELAYVNSDQYKPNHTEEAFSAYDFMTGSGWFSTSALYFGHYTHEIIELINGWYYNMPLAYLLCIGVNSIINLVAVSFCLTSSYQKNYIDTAGDVKHLFCNKVFSAWDYSIETEDAARLRKIAFCTEIKELLSFMRRDSRKKTSTDKVVQVGLMILINTCCLGIAVAVNYGIYILLERKALKVGVRILEDMALSLTVTSISSTIYFILSYFIKLEFYLTRKTKLYLTMIRAVILRTTMVGIIVYFWMTTKSSDEQNQCYEDELGKEIYRLIFVNFVVAVIFFTFGFEFIRKVISSYILKNDKLSRFDVAFNTLDLIYYQMLVWVASFCMPLAPLLMIIILILLFYLKLNSVVSNCRPPKRSWSVNEAQTFFLSLLFFMNLLSAFAVGYFIFALKPSNCGPFKEYKKTVEIIHEIFFAKGEEHETSEIVKYLSSPGVLFAVFCALCVILYYARAQSKAHIAVVKIIREQLIMEGKDKVFLLKLFDEALAMHSQANAIEKSDENKDPSPPKRESTNDTNQDVFFNETYNEYYDRPLNSPLPRNLEPGYIPANVPVNKSPLSSEVGAVYNSPRADTKFRPPVNSAGDCDSPARRSKGILIPSHQPGFRHILGEDSPRVSNEGFKFYNERI
uniref:Putative TMC-5 n=1 Tax=Cupiennius salei TaxID=6928 RepID=A0A061QLK4_CUPSA